MEHTRPREEAPPSALDELARDDSSRKRFLRMAGGSAVAAGLSAALAACGGSKEKSTSKATALGPLAQYGPGDVGVLNYALSLEFLETAFYLAAVQSGKLTGRNLALAQRFGAEESQHARALMAAVQKLGATPVKPQKTTFPLGSERGILGTASAIENLGAGAYLGQIDRIQGKEVLALVLSIHTVEGRHASAIDSAIGRSITPDGPFATPISALDVQGQIQTFLAG
jgi:Ferritin-like domain